ncbi:hypothetical protein SAMN04489761_3821 [Tenacibaculum sp. MAR_2009_124]|uniref:hypothetical protein n=1 Tax=Tenacibaculum sp. MAR_2009_124 TaxID=1250059 RepID=UPI0008997DF4|nr:hypothetical protein [Tenacibaculum sp. MAR_2009_124]SEC86933.1 hypothetical protein SAMN04489761_3821 [Tenacibaculum sp. MAR_2009_124]
MKKEKENENEKEEHVHMSNELATSEWFGAIVRYLLGFCREEFSYYYNKRNIKRNVVVGYIVKLVLLVILIGVFVYFLKE